MDLSRPLRRSVANRSIAGVCGGLSEYFGIDATVGRVAYVLASILFGVVVGGVVLYLVLWAIIREREYY
jgi:phage shock protein C